MIRTLAENPALRSALDALHSGPWPAYLDQGEAVRRHWAGIYERFPGFQLVLTSGDEVVAGGNSGPMAWNGEFEGLPGGFDEALQRIVEPTGEPDVLCGLAAVVSREHLGEGLSTRVLAAFKQIARRHGLSRVLLPVRPTLKARYPAVSMGSYVQWRKGDLPFDPWLRVHVRMGGRILGVAERSLVVEGTVSRWREWTGMHFGESQHYVVEGALSLVSIDLDADLGTYVEPNVWVVHDCG